MVVKPVPIYVPSSLVVPIIIGIFFLTYVPETIFDGKSGSNLVGPPIHRERAPNFIDPLAGSFYIFKRMFGY